MTRRWKTKGFRSGGAVMDAPTPRATPGARSVALDAEVARLLEMAQGWNDQAERVKQRSLDAVEGRLPPEELEDLEQLEGLEDREP